MHQGPALQSAPTYNDDDEEFVLHTHHIHKRVNHPLPVHRSVYSSRVSTAWRTDGESSHDYEVDIINPRLADVLQQSYTDATYGRYNLKRCYFQRQLQRTKNYFLLLQ